MLRWLLKTLWRQRLSLLASAGGIAGAFTLVVILDAVFVGESTQVVSYLRHMNADVWVMQRGVGNMHMASSFVWDWKADRIALVPGVRRATPILYAGATVNANGRNWLTFLVGLLPDGARAGPWSLASGKPVPAPGEIVLPRVYAEMNGVALGDTVRVRDLRLRVVGLSEGTFSMGNSVAFLAFSDLADLFSITGTVSYILVDAEPGTDPVALAPRIEREVEKVSALPQEDFIRNDFQLAMLMGVEIIFFMTVIGSALATLIIAFTAYSQVTQRRRELAIAKALGMRNRAIYLAVLAQTLIITALGFALALLAAWGLFPALSAAVPQITLVVTPTALVRTGVLALLVALAAALVPAHLVNRVDPQTVFRV